MTGRIGCCVPFCRRTRGPRKGDRVPISSIREWICAEHYRATPASLRRRRSRILRMIDRASGVRLFRLYDIDRRIWDRLKAAAIERAAGITS
ncbi:hypothetical protein [Phreatobacter oligotrophus]|uniref:Uncharacterized protein n=1 Tax=Phreatobacter oligotrophus TaxID=1122261 RepID=A0A2T4ZIW1_9HYPH|nr:hypothetical protein [Phreatobacter oligotrophus]PTM61920.1 hypothetical protein C8P69_101593 [Phreatobacter oligotrophus]